MQNGTMTTTPLSREEFLQAPISQGYNTKVEEFRSKEYPQLDNVTYLDHAGTTLYSTSLITAFSADLLGNLYGNPHSQSLSSLHTSKRIDDVRLRVLRLFNADPREFDVVFVANATAGMKLVVEAIGGYTTRRNRKKRERQGGNSKEEGWKYWYHKDAHTSLVGVRECADPEGGGCLDSDQAVEDWINSEDTDMDTEEDSDIPPPIGLFAWPAQSNFSGRRTPLHWAGEVRSKKKNVYTLLDAAALVTTSPLDLSNPANSPDFTVLSFYKMFGYPDLGCLIIRTPLLPLLSNRLYFGGGTVEAVVSHGPTPFHAKRKQIHTLLEDGTLPFHSILTLEHALQTHTTLYTSFTHISAHTTSLASYLYSFLSSLTHSNGTPLVHLYSSRPHSLTQGPILTFNLRRPDGSWIGYSEVEKLAAVKNIHIRTGGLCNPGGVESHIGIEPWEVRSNYDSGHRCWDERDVVRGKPTGAIRVSLGPMTTWKDVERVGGFVREAYRDRLLVAGTWGARGAEARRFSWMRGGKGEVKTEEERKEEKGKEGLRVEIEKIMVYPIKSCAGFEVPRGEKWEVLKTGLRWDREWCLVHLGTSRALDQKRFPRMALIKPTINLTSQTLTITVPSPEGSEESEGVTPSSPPQTLTIPLNPTVSTPLTLCPTRLCGEQITTETYPSPDITTFFSTFLDTPCTLARHSKSSPPRAFQDHSPRHTFGKRKRRGSSTATSGSGEDTLSGPSGVGSEDDEATKPKSHAENNPTTAPITLANEAPLLITTSPSLTALNSTLTTPVSPSHFRANIHLSLTAPPYTEETLTHVRLDSGVVVNVLGKCKRCRMITVDQTLGEMARGKVYEVVVRERGGFWGVLGGVGEVGWVAVGGGGWGV